MEGPNCYREKEGERETLSWGTLSEVMSWRRERDGTVNGILGGGVRGLHCLRAILRHVFDWLISSYLIVL